MNTKELRQRTKKELEGLLISSQEKLRKLKFELANKKLKNVHEFKQTKKEIARLLTILKESPSTSPLDYTRGRLGVKK